MKIPSRLRRLLTPSLGKIGMLGIALCLALGAYAPPAPVDLTVSSVVQPRQSHPTAQAVFVSSPRR